MRINGREVACRGCVYWQTFADNPNGIEPGKEKGRCKRNPPEIHYSAKGAGALWPVTFAYEWCGEHAGREG
ncbi:MAG: hypothetical protein Kow0032_07480 [Methyloligellaceae bacterium]